MLIKLYQLFISPITHLINYAFFGTAHSCRFFPTCSQYFATAVAKYGIIHGSILGLKRLFRCHPYSQTPHFDPVP